MDALIFITEYLGIHMDARKEAPMEQALAYVCCPAEEKRAKLQKYCRKDPVKTVVVDMTALNIVEVTRQKVKKSLAEQAAELDWKGETGWKNSGDEN